MKTAGALGNLEESFRPFLGRIVFPDCVHGSTRVRRKPEGDYGIAHPLHCRFAGNRRTYMVSDGVQSGTEREARNDWFVGSTAQQQRKNDNAAQKGDYSFSRSSATSNRRCTIAKARFFESPHRRTSRNTKAARFLNQMSNLTLNHGPKWLRSSVKWVR